MKAFIMRFIHPVYRDKPIVVFQLTVFLLAYACICYMKDQLFAFVGAVVYSSIALRSLFVYFEKKMEK